MNKKETINSFSEGLIMDLNPINSPKTSLTDCLNGTIITYNGNEHSLQNDQGNYPLSNCKLNANYIPVGLKEYADILYIVSYNPINKCVEIGSYPSPETTIERGNIDKLSQAVPSILSRLKNKGLDFNENNKYSDIYENMQDIKIFYGINSNLYKLNPGDKYKLSTVNNDVESTFEELKYYIVDDNRKVYDVTDRVKKTPKEIDENGFAHVEWDVPGWFAVQTRWAELNDLDVNIKKIFTPLYGNQKMQLELNVQTTSSDKLFINNLPLTKASLKARLQIYLDDDEVVSELLSLDNQLNLNNGNYMFFSNLLKRDDITYNNKKTLTIKVVPYLDVDNKIIIYDKLEKTLAFNLSEEQKVENINIGENVWKYNVNGDKFTLTFDTSGLNRFSDNIYLFYSLKRVDNSPVINYKTNLPYTKIRCESWNIIGETIVDLEFADFEKDWTAHKNYFYAEDFYMVDFLLYDNPNATGSPLKEYTSKFITASILLNDFDTQKFDEISFDQWVNKLNSHIKNKIIKLSGGVKGNVVISDPEFNNVYREWTDNSKLTKFPAFSYWRKADLFKKPIELTSIATIPTEVTCDSEVRLLTGPMWEDLVDNAWLQFNLNGDGVSGSEFNKNGTIKNKYKGVINNFVRKTIKFKLKQETDRLTIWNYDKQLLQYSKCETMAWANIQDNSIQFPLLVVTGELAIHLSGAPNVPEDTFIFRFKDLNDSIIREHSFPYLSHFEKLFKQNDVLLYKCKVGTLVGSKDEFGNHTGINSYTKEYKRVSPNYFNDNIEDYFALFKMKNFTVGIVHIPNVIDYNDAELRLKQWLNNVRLLKCHPSSKTDGYFFKALKENNEILENNVLLNSDGFIRFKSFKYNIGTVSYNLLDDFGRNAVGVHANHPKNLSLSQGVLFNFIEDLKLDESKNNINVVIDFSGKDVEFDQQIANINLRNNLVQNNILSFMNDTVFSTHSAYTEKYIKEQGIHQHMEALLKILNEKKLSQNSTLYYEASHNINGREIMIRYHLGAIDESISI